MESESVLQIVSSLGVAAVLGWYLYYTTTVSFPKMNDATLNRMDRMQEKQNVVIENVCKDFTTCLREERIVRRDELMILRNELKAMHSREDSVDGQ